MSFWQLIKRPSAFLPVLMSLAALAIVLGHIALFGAAREPDEGTAAHLFQLLMAAQLPIVAWFAVVWFPRHPQPALQVLALHVIAGLAAFAPVYYFQL